MPPRDRGPSTTRSPGVASSRRTSVATRRAITKRNAAAAADGDGTSLQDLLAHELNDDEPDTQYKPPAPDSPATSARHSALLDELLAAQTMAQTALGSLIKLGSDESTVARAQACYRVQAVLAAFPPSWFADAQQ